MRENADNNAAVVTATTAPDPVQFEPDRELLALLRLADALGKRNTPPSRSVTTSLIFFSLASIDKHPQALHQQISAEAMCFFQSLRELAGDHFELAWISYFSFRSAEIDTASQDHAGSSTLVYSGNAETWLQRAARVAQGAGRNSTTIGDLISALWSLERGKFKSLLRKMEIDLGRLCSSYEQRLLSWQELQKTNVVRKHLMHDRASHLDQMGFGQYAIAIAEFLISDDTHGPISISIQAPWGAGKSSLMRQIQHQLDPQAGAVPVPGMLTTRDVLRFLDRKAVPPPTRNAESKRWTVWFNAWKYESSEQVWAGLVDAIVSQVSDRLGPVEREIFLLRLNLSRIDDGVVRRKIYDRVVTFWWVKVRRWILAAAALIMSLLSASAIPSLPIWLSNDSVVTIPAAIGTQIAIAAYTVWAYFTTRKKVANEPATFSLAEYVRVPDYARTVGIMHHIHQDLRRILEALPKREMHDGSGATVTEPLVIFIDDLDRCSPNKIASVVEGLNTFLAGDQSEFLFVIGMDPQMVAAALEHAHRDVKKHLPSYEQLVPLGWRFMDKFIQLAFTIPPSRHLKNGTFIDCLIGPETQAGWDAAAGQAAPASSDTHEQAAEPDQQAPGTDSAASATSEERQRRESRHFMNDGQDVQTVMRGISRDYACGPRQIKRTLNFVRLVLLLRIARTVHRLPVPALEQYQRWIVLCIRWPDMALWLQWGGSMPPHTSTTPAMEDIAAKRLYCLEECTTLPENTNQKWGRSAAVRLGLPMDEVAWLADPEIYHFFSHEMTLPQSQRLSTGAAIGFY